jgi:predicted NUDIX family phosphoesterase
MPTPEQVIALPSSWVASHLHDPLTVVSNHFLEAMAKVAIPVPRPQAEEDETFKHIISYFMIQSEESRDERIMDPYRTFVYRRKCGSEARLHGKLSLGIGGHVNLEDSGESGDSAGRITSRTLIGGAARELFEEVEFKTIIKETSLIGIINSNENKVDRVHLGILFLVWIPSISIILKDCNSEPLGFLYREEIIARRAEFEGWSQILIDYLL